MLLNLKSFSFSSALISLAFCLPSLAATPATPIPAKPPTSVVLTPISAQFNYSVNLRVDFEKRKKILLAQGQEPTIYDKALSFVKGDFHAANITDQVNFTKDAFRVLSTTKGTTAIGFAIGNKALTRDSGGIRNADGIFTSRYSERRGDADPITTIFERNNKKLAFYEGMKVKGTQAFDGNLQDILSILYANLNKAPTAKTQTVNYTDGKSIRSFTLVRGEAWEFPFNGTKVRAIRYYKLQTKEEQATVEVWYAETNGIPVRFVIGLGDKFGGTLTATLDELPKL